MDASPSGPNSVKDLPDPVWPYANLTPGASLLSGADARRARPAITHIVALKPSTTAAMQSFTESYTASWSAPTSNTWWYEHWKPLSGPSTYTICGRGAVQRRDRARPRAPLRRTSLPCTCTTVSSPRSRSMGGRTRTSTRMASSDADIADRTVLEAISTKPNDR